MLFIILIYLKFVVPNLIHVRSNKRSRYVCTDRHKFYRAALYVSNPEAATNIQILTLWDPHSPGTVNWSEREAVNSPSHLSQKGWNARPVQLVFTLRPSSHRDPWLDGRDRRECVIPLGSTVTAWVTRCREVITFMTLWLLAQFYNRHKLEGFVSSPRASALHSRRQRRCETLTTAEI
jgi:hypothetical protein